MALKVDLVQQYKGIVLNETRALSVHQQSHPNSALLPYHINAPNFVWIFTVLY